MQKFEHTIELQRLASTDQSVRYSAVLSTETPVKRGYATEILEHSADSIDMTRAKRGLPLLVNHKMEALIGRVSDIKLDGKKLRGLVEFDTQDPDGAKWAEKVNRGFAGDISISGDVMDMVREEDNNGNVTYRVKKWTPIEVSMASVAADPAAGINRSYKEVKKMDIENGNGDGGNVVTFERGVNKGKGDGVAAERQRVDEIMAYFETRKLKTKEAGDLMRRCIAEGFSVERAAMLYADLAEQGVTEQGQPIEQPVTVSRAVPQQPYGGRRVDVTLGRDEWDGWSENVRDSLLLRTGFVRNVEERRKLQANVEFAHVPLSDIARDYLRRTGVSLRGMTPKDIVGQALIQRNIGVGQTASDFTSILANVAEKAAGVGYDEAAETWRMWCRIGSVSDFKQGKRVNLSAFSNLDEVPDGGNYKVGKFSDVGEPIQAKEYAKNFVISRQALINDDTDAFSRIPEAMGRAAARKVGDVVYITTLKGAAGVGPTLSQDATALFDASTHANYVTSGAAPSIDTLNAGFVAMATQTEPSGQTINVEPAYLIVPKALQTTALVLANSINAPEGGRQHTTADDTRGPSAANPFYKRLTVVADSRLDNSAFKGATGWYLAAAPNQADTIEVAFLQGAETPTIRQEEQISRSGVTYLVRLDFAVAALDYRGLYYNDGD